MRKLPFKFKRLYREKDTHYQEPDGFIDIAANINFKRSK